MCQKRIEGSNPSDSASRTLRTSKGLIRGWCKDQWGLSWQITPRALMAAIADPDRAAAQRAFEAMMQMGKIDIAALEAARRG